jgi:hypothetical protein
MTMLSTGLPLFYLFIPTLPCLIGSGKLRCFQRCDAQVPHTNIAILVSRNKAMVAVLRRDKHAHLAEAPSHKGSILRATERASEVPGTIPWSSRHCEASPAQCRIPPGTRSRRRHAPASATGDPARGPRPAPEVTDSASAVQSSTELWDRGGTSRRNSRYRTRQV